MELRVRAPRHRRWERLCVMGLSLALAAVFATIGMAILCSPVFAEHDAQVGHEAWSRIALGVFHLACACFLLTPRTAPNAAVLLGVVSLGVCVDSFKHSEGISPFVPALLGVGVVLVGACVRLRLEANRRIWTNLLADFANLQDDPPFRNA